MKIIEYILFSLVLAFPALAQNTTAIKCGRLIDGKKDQVTENAVIIVEENIIKQVGQNLSIPKGAKIIDLSGYTVLPGLIDGHTHVLLQGDITEEDYAEQILKESIPYRTLRASLACKIALMNGFTTLRDVETEGAMYADVDLKKAINNGVIDGPRMYVSGRAINTTGHYILSNKTYAWELHMPKGVQEITGADEARKAVREQISYGIDWIKIYADRGYYRLPDGSFRSIPNFTNEEITAIGDETKVSRKKLAAHAVTRDGIIYAINAGANSIEHGFAMDDECMRLMIEKNIYWCPTIYVNVWVAEGRAAAGSPINKQFNEILPTVFNKALKSGVKIVFGTDVGGFPWTENQAKEFSYMVKWGMSPMQAIKSATSMAAEMLDAWGKIGEISPGAYADIIAVKEDPLKNISVLENVSFVMKDGKIYKQ
ncbi:amidohydrolase family protein [bacterium]|nr:MAG: amidohydrolase family protein [bacterium]